MGIEGYYEDYFDERQEKKLTNFQKIKSMSIEEMAEFIYSHITCGFCPLLETCSCEKYTYVKDRSGKCYKTIKQWLKEESEG